MRFACPHIHAAVFAALCALALACAPVAAAQKPCPSASAVPAELSKRAVVRSTLCLLNAERDKQGAPPLRLNSRLAKAALGHARDMARKDYFAHDSQSGANFVDRIKRTGYLNGVGTWTVGENIAWATGSAASPRAIVQAWMHSAGHRANILSGAFHEIGIGVAQDPPVADAGPGGTYATDFGSRG
ncbi:MAG TPA: CAP domain-containing protein [Thermoleophilaceae bacterium]